MTDSAMGRVKFGSILRELRTALGVSAADLADAISMDRSAYHAAERGDRLLRADRMLMAAEFLMRRKRVASVQELIASTGVRDAALFMAWAESEAMEQVARVGRRSSAPPDPNQLVLPLE